MKRKAYLAALVMCMALAVNGCGNNKSEADSSGAQAAEPGGRYLIIQDRF